MRLCQGSPVVGQPLTQRRLLNRSAYNILGLGEACGVAVKILGVEQVRTDEFAVIPRSRSRSWMEPKLKNQLNFFIPALARAT